MLVRYSAEDTMRRLFLPVLCMMLTVASAQGAPGDDAADAFRNYVAAIRAGSVDDTLKLVEPVPESSKPLLQACVESAIAVEKVKTEMAKQMGPPKHEEGWNMGQQPDDVLKTLRGVAAGDTAKLVAKDPMDQKAEFDVGVAVRSEGKWLVAAATAIGIDPPSKFVEPPPDERERLLKLANFTTSAGKTVLARLQKKEFKSPGEVQDALIQEMMRAGSK
jgi:hypothetical protein